MNRRDYENAKNPIEAKIDTWFLNLPFKTKCQYMLYARYLGDWNENRDSGKQDVQ